MAVSLEGVRCQRVTYAGRRPIFLPCPIDPQACGLMFCQSCEEEEHECVHPDELEAQRGGTTTRCRSKRMKAEIPSAVILDAQKRIYEIKDDLPELEQVVKDRSKELEEANKNLAYRRSQLREFAEFLSNHNHEAVDHPGEWFVNVGLEAPRCEGACRNLGCTTRCSKPKWHERYPDCDPDHAYHRCGEASCTDDR